MGEKIAFENGQISDFQGLVTMTFTLDWVMLHITKKKHKNSQKHHQNPE